MEIRTFREILRRHLESNAKAPHLSATECRSSDRKLCSACHGSAVGYESEVSLKNEALQEFWSLHQPGSVALAPLIRSAHGRHYRAISKRKVVPVSRSYVFALLSPEEDGGVTPLQVFDCLIEPREHGEVYRVIHEAMSAPSARPLLGNLNYVIVKGNSGEQTVILNVRTLAGGIAKSANAVSRSLTKAVPSVSGVFLFEGEQDDRYYLGSKRSGPPSTIRKVFGKDKIFARVSGKSFLFSPLSFSQVNPGILEDLLSSVKTHLDLRGNETLYDLYSGYGLFAISFADKVTRSSGAEWSRDSVGDAARNAERNGANNVRFTAMNINAEGVHRMLSRSRPEDVVLLDPPRNGTAPGVIETVASHHVRRVVHLFCNIDLLPAELEKWRQSGYALVAATPVDMFPGTDSVEIVTALSPR